MSLTKEEILVNSLIQFLEYSKIKVGDRLLPERELSQKFNASRNTLRSAIKNLQAKGIIEVKPRSGYYLKSSINLKYHIISNTWENKQNLLKQQLEAFFLIEPVIVECCAKRISKDEIHQLERNLVALSKAIIEKNASKIAQIHKFIYQSISLATKNKMMLITLENYDSMFEAESLIFSDLTLTERSNVFAKHVKLVNSIKSKDVIASGNNIRLLISNLAQLLSKYRSIPIPEEISIFIINIQK